MSPLSNEMKFSELLRGCFFSEISISVKLFHLTRTPTCLKRILFSHRWGTCQSQPQLHLSKPNWFFYSRFASLVLFCFFSNALILERTSSLFLNIEKIECDQIKTIVHKHWNNKINTNQTPTRKIAHVCWNVNQRMTFSNRCLEQIQSRHKWSEAHKLLILMKISENRHLNRKKAIAIRLLLFMCFHFYSNHWKFSNRKIELWKIKKINPLKCLWGSVTSGLWSHFTKESKQIGKKKKETTGLLLRM